MGVPNLALIIRLWILLWQPRNSWLGPFGFFSHCFHSHDHWGVYIFCLFVLLLKSFIGINCHILYSNNSNYLHFHVLHWPGYIASFSFVVPFKKILVLLEDNYFTILWWFLPFISMNEPYVYLCPFPLKPPSQLLPIPPLLVVTEHQLWVPCFIQQTPTGYLFYIW